MEDSNTHKMTSSVASSLQLAKVRAITNFFQEFLRIVIQEISKLSNFEYQVI
jgi:hypothetical protein